MPTATDAGPTPDDPLIALLLAGDGDAYAAVVRAWTPTMLRVARAYVNGEQSAQDVVQETWLAVLRGLPRFEGRSSLRTWVFRILVNTARSRGAHDGRIVPVASFGDPELDGPGYSVPPGRFEGPGEWDRHWVDDEPRPWRGDPARGALRAETRRLLENALDDLPPRQRAVVVLRDVEGMAAVEVCEMLGLTQQNQRVLLHRGRAKVRMALETYYLDEEPTG